MLSSFWIRLSPWPMRLRRIATAAEMLLLYEFGYDGEVRAFRVVDGDSPAETPLLLLLPDSVPPDAESMGKVRELLLTGLNSALGLRLHNKNLIVALLDYRHRPIKVSASSSQGPCLDDLISTRGDLEIYEFLDEAWNSFRPTEMGLTESLPAGPQKQ